MAKVFKKACAPIETPCVRNGQNFINPCNCSSYLQCDNGKVIIRPCSIGTVWNPNVNNCWSRISVECDEDMPWKRCKNVIDAYSQGALRQSCVDGVSLEESDRGSSSNTGAIVGGIVGGILFVAIIVVIIVLYLRKKKKDSSITRKSNSFALHRPPPQKEKEEEIYDVIEERRPQPTVAASAPDLPPNRGGPAEYHNSGYYEKTEEVSGATANVPNGDYNDLQRDDKEDESKHYSTLEITKPEDFNRSINIGGRDVPVEDRQGYQIRYPSGTFEKDQPPRSTKWGLSSLYREPSEADAATNEDGYFELEEGAQPQEERNN